MTTDPSTLPQYKGRPVPWITRWSQELLPERHDLAVVRREDGGLAIGYKDGQAENRDTFGVLWQREGLAQGTGEPMWRAVNTYRQRACMLRSKCQVCGKEIEDPRSTASDTPVPIRWLMPLNTLQWINDERTSEPVAVTHNAPTCPGCLPLALDVCPNLRASGYQVYLVLDWGIWGVRGMHHFMANGSIQRKPALVPYDLTGLEHTPAWEGATLAQQAVVVWNKFVLKETHQPEEAPDGA